MGPVVSVVFLEDPYGFFPGVSKDYAVSDPPAAGIFSKPDVPSSQCACLLGVVGILGLRFFIVPLSCGLFFFTPYINPSFLNCSNKSDSYEA